MNIYDHLDDLLDFDGACYPDCGCGDDPDNLWPDTPYVSYDDFASMEHTACKACGYLFSPQSLAQEFCETCEPFQEEYDLTVRRQFDLLDWIEVGEYSYCALCGMNTTKCSCFEAPDEGVTSDIAWLEQITERSPHEFTHLSAFIARRYRIS